MAKCSQCGKPAVFQTDPGGPVFCLDCTQKYHAILHANIRAMTEEQDRLLEEMEMISGVALRPPKPAPIVTGPIHYNHIQIDRSTVGVVNTGQIGHIDTAIGMIKGQANPDLGNLLAQFTQAVLRERTLSAEQRREVIDLLETLSGQLVAPREHRKQGLLKAVLAGVQDVVSVAAGLATLWNAVSSAVAAHLGITL